MRPFGRAQPRMQWVRRAGAKAHPGIAETRPDLTQNGLLRNEEILQLDLEVTSGEAGV